MSRRKTKPEEIRNPERYFNKYLSLEVKDQYRKRRDILMNEDSLEERSEFASFHIQTAVNTDGEYFAKIESSAKYCEWIKNAQLLRAVEELSDSERKLLRQYFYEGISQKALAANLGVSQQAISKVFHRIFRKIKKIF